MENERPDANWWSFSVDSERRKDKIKDDPSQGTGEVNPELAGKRLLSYHKYLRLDRLLTSQVPSSFVPDERIFIITHQLFELVFKQMIFDVRVIADTFRLLLDKGEGDLCDLSLRRSGQRAEDFWLPALTASERLRHSSQKLIGDIMTYLLTENMFDNDEFGGKFRSNLPPASGFQSAQFRLIQRAFGKSPLLGLRLFPADSYLKNYLGKDDEEIRRITYESESAGLVCVVDGLILREGASVATPPAGSPLAPVARLDDLAHEVLCRIADLRTIKEAYAGEECGTSSLPSDELSLEGMEDTFRTRLKEVMEKIKGVRNEPAALTEEESALVDRRSKVFREDWAAAVGQENRRRAAYGTACRAARFLYEERQPLPLRSVLDNLMDADKAFSGRFLLLHQKMVEKRIGHVPGTAGGGVPYLDFSRSLIGWFPALVMAGAKRTSTAGEE